MNIIISNADPSPIYEQIKNQIKNQIAAGYLKEGDMLPGMRSLAKDLKVSVITTKRAYKDLENDGYIYTASGRGCFVKRLNSELVREENLAKIEEYFNESIKLASLANVSDEDLLDLLGLLLRGEE